MKLLIKLLFLFFFISPFLVNAQRYTPPPLPPPSLDYIHSPFYFNHPWSQEELEEIQIRKHKRFLIEKENITALKSGVLVVRLKTGHNKLKALERVANSPKISAKNKEKFNLKIAEHKKETLEENELLLQSLNEHYTFSEIYFIADTSVHLLKEGMQSGFFLNDNLEIDPSISLNEKTFFIAFYGSTISATKIGEEGLVVMDENFKELREPFPYFTGLTTTRKALGKFFSMTDEAEYFNIMTQRFNNRLTKFMKVAERKTDAEQNTEK